MTEIPFVKIVAVVIFQVIQHIIDFSPTHSVTTGTMILIQVRMQTPIDRLTLGEPELVVQITPHLLSQFVRRNMAIRVGKRRCTR